MACFVTAQRQAVSRTNMKHTDTTAVNPRLHQGSNGIYEIRWTDGARSKRKSTKTSDKQEALLKLGAFIISRNKRERARTDPLVRDILEMYVREHVERNVVDYGRQMDCIANLVEGFGSMRPSEIGSHVDNIGFYSDWRAKGRQGRRPACASTVRRELGVLVAAMNHAVRRRALPREHVPHVTLPKASPPRDLWMTQEELDTFIARALGCGGRIATFVLIASHTAARKNSIMTLRWSQVDLERKVINFQDSSDPATKKRRVPVPMTSALHTHLSALRAARSPSADDLVLGTTSSLRRDFDRVCAMAAKEHGDRLLNVTPHTLRHTWATLAARNRVPVFEIAGVLGDDVQTVSRVYAKHHPDHLRSAVGFMDSAPSSS